MSDAISYSFCGSNFCRLVGNFYLLRENREIKRPRLVYEVPWAASRFGESSFSPVNPIFANLLHLDQHPITKPSRLAGGHPGDDYWVLLRGSYGAQGAN